jgi:lysophospholipase L1-like esterase
MGCGYDRIENVLWRVYHGQLDGLTADRINLAIGTNNFSTSTPEQIIYGLERLIEAIRVRRPEAELVMMGILPRRNKEKDVKSLNKEIKEMAKRMGVRYEDPGKALLQKDGKIDESLFTDGLHPNEAGYRLIQPWFK